MQVCGSTDSGLRRGLHDGRPGAGYIYGNCEKRYAEILKPRIYCRHSQQLGYGVKLIPNADRIPLNDQQMG